MKNKYLASVLYLTITKLITMSFFSRLFGGKKPQPAPAPAPAPVKYAADEVFDFRHIKDLNNVVRLDTCSRRENAMFRKILQENFSDCNVRKAVAASELFPDAPSYAMPINFFITKGETKLALFLLERGQAKRYSYLETKELCYENGVECMTFFLHLPNEEDYVFERLNSVLG